MRRLLLGLGFWVALATTMAAGLPRRSVAPASPAWPLDARGRGPLRIVFVSRNPAPDAGKGGVPGVGPKHRALATGGKLMVADGRGQPSELSGAGSVRYFDVSDPAVSPDGRRLAFAATTHPDSGWRIRFYFMDGGASARSLRAIPDAGVSNRYDELDPCWLDDSTLVFASTREGQRSQYDRTPVTQIYRFHLRDQSLARLTAERNGAEEPCVDPRNGRIVYSRWWFNRIRPASAKGDTVNFWQAISIAADGSDPRVVATSSDPRHASLYQPAIADDGSIFGVVGDALGLSPNSGATEITWRPHPNAPPRHVAGARFDPADTPRYGSTRGLAAPAALSPAALADGRVIYSLDPGGRGNFGIWLANRDGSNAAPLVDLPGTLELDAVPWESRRLGHAMQPAIALAPSPRSIEELERWPARFRFFNRNVFGGGFGTREAKDARASGPIRIRFWATLPREDAEHGDTLVLVRESEVARNGRVDERDLPAGVPMFEQLVDAKGAVLQSAHGPAHVAGHNVGIPGKTASCIGCHRGHSMKR
ncbi:MAG: hypothetical protein ABIS67_03080 [Candidatus Eisenbacteria bacterium]